LECALLAQLLPPILNEGWAVVLQPACGRSC
jgi:hypothetical protein